MSNTWGKSVAIALFSDAKQSVIFAEEKSSRILILDSHTKTNTSLVTYT